MTAPKPTLPSAKPEVGTAKIWRVEKQAELSWVVWYGDEWIDEFAEEDGAHGFVEDWKRRMSEYAKSIAAKAAEKAAEEIDDTFDAIERGASIPFGVEEVAAIIQKCFDTEIEREQ